MDLTSNIPNDALGLVFHQCTHASVRDLKDWKGTLSLLHVCRRWRKVALPHVYSALCINLVPISSQSQDAEFSAGSSKAIIKDNICLIDSLNLGSFPRKLIFSYTGIASLRYGLDGLSEMFLSGSSAPWPNVSMLDIRFNWWITPDDSEREDDLDTKKMDSIATAYAQQLSIAVPNITRLVCFNDSLLSLPKAVDSKIADAFVSQLQLFTVLGPLQLSVPKFSPELTWLRFCLDERNTSLSAFPRSFSRSLQYLCIYYMSDEIAWQLFVDDSSPFNEGVNSQKRDITFERLTQLELHYFFANDGIIVGSSPLESGYTDSQQYKLRFPQLTRLRINGCPSNCDFFANSELPSKLQVLNIEGMLDAVEVMSGLSLPAVELIRFQQSPGVPLRWWQNNTDVLNGFLERHSGSKCTGLILQSDTDYRLAPEVIEKAKIAHLSIAKEIGVDEMLEIVEVLPDLVKLVVLSLAFRRMPAYVEHYDSSAQGSSPQTPKTRIREIVIWDYYRQPLPQQAKDSLAAYLRKWLPTLLSVKFN